jgi:hypothetical protein
MLLCKLLQAGNCKHSKTDTKLYNRRLLLDQAGAALAALPGGLRSTGHNKYQQWRMSSKSSTRVAPSEAW